MKSNRRNFLILGAGAATGAVFTPLPWKLTDDVSIWSQNWGWLPKNVRGEVTVKQTACTLCDGGCGLTARCVGGRPFSLTGLSTDPLTGGVLCARAFGAHQMPYHTARIKAPRAGGAEVGVDAVASQVSTMLRAGRGAVAVIDETAGRASSETLHAFAQACGAQYVLSAQRAGSRCVPDVSKVQTLVSIGAPVLETWGCPGAVLTKWRSGQLRVIFAGPELSPTAALADRFIAIRPGGEHAFAYAVAKACGAQLGTSVADAARMAGTTEQAVAEVAAMIGGSKTALAVAADGLPPEANDAVTALNAALGTEAIRERTPQPYAEPEGVGLDSIPDGSLKAAVIYHGPDGGRLAWSTLQKKLTAGGKVVSITPYLAGLAIHADFVLPVPALFESLEDLGPNSHSPAPAYTVAPALIASANAAPTLSEWLSKIGGAEVPGAEAVARKRVNAIAEAKRGSVFSFGSGESKAVRDFKSADKLWEAFSAGARWTGAQEDSKPVRVQAPPQLAEPAEIAPGVTVVAAGQPAVTPPLSCKLDLESTLERRAGWLYLNPSDARELGLRESARARIGERVLPVAFDGNLMRGTAFLLDAENTTHGRHMRAEITRA